VQVCVGVWGGVFGVWGGGWEGSHSANVRDYMLRHSKAVMGDTALQTSAGWNLLAEEGVFGGRGVVEGWGRGGRGGGRQAQVGELCVGEGGGGHTQMTPLHDKCVV
jgi:hypothetical protein